MSAVDLTTTLAGMTLRNPVTTASGTFASGREYADFMDLAKLGAITTKGVSLEPWAGGPSPRIAETASGMLNAIGLQNPGADAFAENDLPWLAAQEVPVILNVAGHHLAEYAEVIERLERAPEARAIWAWELNVSCPNVDDGGMAFGVDRAAAAEVTRRAREVTRKPLLVKLSPNVTDIVGIADAVACAGADGVSLINTVLGMSIDAETRRPRLARTVGGLSGPAIKPVALRAVWQVHKELPGLPIVGMGGIMTGEDAVEFMLAGATMVAVGTANFVDPTSAVRVVDGIREYCVRHGMARSADLVGALQEAT